MYRAHGLSIRSDYRLPMLPGPITTTPDLVVVRGEDDHVPVPGPPLGTPLAIAKDADGGVFYSITRTRDGVELHWPGRCVMRADAHVGHVVVHHEPGADDDFVAVLVAGTLVSLHLVLAGRLVLHASAVDVDGTALAFVGTSGMGKSTVATLFARSGHRLVTDDVLHVAQAGPEGTDVYRGGIELRLRDRVVGLADGGMTRTTGDGRTALILPMSSADILPLKACLIPQPSSTATRVDLHGLTGVEAMLALLRFPRLAGWSESTTRARQFEMAGDVAANTPVYVASIPWGPPFDPTIPEQVLALLDIAPSR